MSQRQLYHLFNQCQLLSAATNVVITDSSKGFFFFLKMEICINMIQDLIKLGQITSRLMGSPSQWMTVSGATMQYGAGSVSTTRKNEKPLKHSLQDLRKEVTFEFNSTHASSNNKNIPFVNWAICFQEVWLQVHIK